MEYTNNQKFTSTNSKNKLFLILKWLTLIEIIIYIIFALAYSLITIIANGSIDSLSYLLFYILTGTNSLVLIVQPFIAYLILFKTLLIFHNLFAKQNQTASLWSLGVTIISPLVVFTIWTKSVNWFHILTQDLASTFSNPELYQVFHFSWKNSFTDFGAWVFLIIGVQILFFTFLNKSAKNDTVEEKKHAFIKAIGLLIGLILFFCTINYVFESQISKKNIDYRLQSNGSLQAQVADMKIQTISTDPENDFLIHIIFSKIDEKITDGTQLKVFVENPYTKGDHLGTSCTIQKKQSGEYTCDARFSSLIPNFTEATKYTFYY